MVYRAFFSYMPLGVFVLLMTCFVAPSCRALGKGVRAQAVCAMFLLFCCAKFLCYDAFGGDVFNPEFPTAVIWVWNWLYSGAMILLVLTAALFFVPRRVKPFLLPVLAWGLSAWGVWNGIKLPEVREVEIVCPGLPASLDGYRIVQIADIHVSSAARRWRTEAIVERANAANADLAVCTGDIVDGMTDVREKDVEPLKNVKAKDGVYFITGNHEFYHDWIGWRSLYDSWGMRFLQNDCVFPRDGLALGGTDDDAFARGTGRAAMPDVGRAFASATNGEFRILLQHRPFDVRENVENHGVGLQLSGHTHGGVMPVLNWLVSFVNNGFVRGVYEIPPDDLAPAMREGRLFVSPGCGQWAGFPIRIFDDPEISVIVLRRKGD